MPSSKKGSWRLSQKERTKQQSKQRYTESTEIEIAKKQDLESQVRRLEARENKLITALQAKAQLEILAVEDLKKVVNGQLLGGIIRPISAMSQPKSRWR